MTLKITDNQYGRLSQRQLGFLLHFFCLCFEGTTLLSKVTPTLYVDIPASPINVTVRWQGTSLLISWSPPPPVRNSLHVSVVGCYMVEYRTLGQWVSLAERVAASNHPSYRWTTASRSASYQFRVYSVAAPCRPDVQARRSLPSRVVTFHTSGLIVIKNLSLFRQKMSAKIILTELN